MCCKYDDEEQDLTQAPTMEWGMGDNTDNSRNYAVLSDIHFQWESRITKVTNYVSNMRYIGL